MMNLSSLRNLTLFGLLTLSLTGACSTDDDDDDDNDVGGNAGTSQGGRVNSGAGSTQAGRSGSNAAGTANDGGLPSVSAGASQGGAGGNDASNASGAGGVGGDGAVAALSDAQILLVLDTLNQGEVEEGYAALPRLSAADVKAFAQLMVTHHGEARQSVAATAEALDEAPSPSETQAQLKAEAETQVARLRATPAAGLDTVYIEQQVAAHAEALALLTELTAVADAEELSELLTTLKATVQQHYARAQELQAGL